MKDHMIHLEKRKKKKKILDDKVFQLYLDKKGLTQEVLAKRMKEADEKAKQKEERLKR